MPPMSDAAKTYAKLIDTMKEIALLGSANSLLGWDERTYMPTGGAAHRAEQMSLIARVTHEQFTSPQIGELLSDLEQSDLVKDPHSDAAANVRELRRVYDRKARLPPAWVQEMSR